MPALADIAPLVRAQREWFDGHGYPDGTAHAEIPLESRIVAIADAFPYHHFGSAVPSGTHDQRSS